MVEHGTTIARRPETSIFVLSSLRKYSKFIIIIFFCLFRFRQFAVLQNRLQTSCEYSSGIFYHSVRMKVVFRCLSLCMDSSWCGVSIWNDSMNIDRLKEMDCLAEWAEGRAKETRGGKVNNETRRWTRRSFRLKQKQKYKQNVVNRGTRCVHVKPTGCHRLRVLSLHRTNSVRDKVVMVSNSLCFFLPFFASDSIATRLTFWQQFGVQSLKDRKIQISQQKKET